MPQARVKFGHRSIEVIANGEEGIECIISIITDTSLVSWGSGERFETFLVLREALKSLGLEDSLDLLVPDEVTWNCVHL